VTDLQQQKQIIKSALKLARGEWQKYLIEYGYDSLGGSSIQWAGSYSKSLRSLCERLKRDGIEARAFFDRNSFTYYLVLGERWAKLCDRVDTILSAAREVYNQLLKMEAHKEIERAQKKLRLRKKLRSLIARCKRVLSDIGRHYSYSLRGYCNSEEAYIGAIQSVEEVERLWDEMRCFVGILLL
jgi:hypothetical protein